MYKKQLFYLVLIAGIVRLLAAGMLELGNDEVYYYTYALHLQSNYFDHPPGVAWLIKLFTLNLRLPQEVFIRLGSVVFATVGTYISFALGKRIKNEQTGWYAALLYNASIYCGVIAGTFILPDSPQVLFWLAGLYYMVTAVQYATENKKIPPAIWLAIGILNGLCIMCKVHGVFLWGGFGLYVLFCNRRLLANPWLYVAALLTAVIISPIITWNIQNHFVTWNYHSNRVEVKQFALDADGFIQTILGQLFYNNPLNVVAIVIALVVLKKKVTLAKEVKQLLLLCGLPIIIITTLVSLFKSVLPHWSGPGFLTLLFVAAAWLDDKKAQEPVASGRTPWLIKSSLILIAVVMLGGIAFIRLLPGTIGSKEEAQYGEDDFTLDLYGWRQFGADFIPWYQQQVQAGAFKADTKIVCDKWFPAAHLDYYAARTLHIPVVGVGELNDLHHYVWLNEQRPTLQPNENALCIVPSNYPLQPDKIYENSFTGARLLHTFTQTRMGQTSRYFRVYLLTGFKGQESTPLNIQ
ncbi:ArnT family glycosyltransferase [Filimonas lacunae]|nr:glycosyltransferase family 39 protein [Filimonas lacunae]BAV08882.1 glycosyl transferase family protein [Filimonas lacunae]